MSDATPLIYFLLITVLINTILLATYSAFEITPTVDEEDIPTVLQFYFDAKDLIDAISIPFVGGIIDIFTLGLFSDFFENLVLVYLHLPIAVSTIILLPMITGAIYSVVKALPTT